MLKSYKYRVYPNPKQEEMFSKHFGCVRFIYNKGLSEKIKSYKKTGKSPSCFDLTKNLLKKLKNELPWLKDVNSQSLQMSLRNLDNAFQSFFRKNNKFPKFKSKHKSIQSFQIPQSVKVNFIKNTINLPKIKNIKTVFSRRFEGKIKTSTISKTSTNKYFISILVDDGKEYPEKVKVRKDTTVGIDLGLKEFAIVSNGEKIDNQKFLKKSLTRIKYLQSKQNHYKLGGKNRKKYNLKIAKLYEKANNKRNDFLHKLSSKLISENQTICLEDLNVRGMMKNHKLAQGISDVSWSRFVEFLKYKSEWYGKNIIQIGRFDPSSKMCSSCGSMNKNLKLSDRTWICESCKVEHDRDINAALNIKEFGLVKYFDFLSGPGQPLDACGDTLL